MSSAIIILAAGKGTRMNSETPKVLHEIAGAPLLAHALASAANIAPERIVVVTGDGAEQVETQLTKLCDAVSVRQTEQLGTGHAVAQAGPSLEGFEGDAIVLYGDTPFISEATLQAMIAERRAGADIVVLGFEAADPAKYGRLVLAGDGTLEKIVEFKDASEDELALTLCNSGVVCADARHLLDLVNGLGNANASGEYYLTDVPAIGRERGLSTHVVICPEAETLGVNSRRDLAMAERYFQDQARAAALDNGVTMTAPETVFFAHDTVIGRDVTIAPNVVFGPGVTVESGAEIKAFCHLEGCHISQGAQVGPYARLRPGAEIGDFAKVGNFVEVKNAQVDEGAKLNHLSYIGDAHVGEAANIGAGTITCNYDGVSKHHTEIGARAFIGSNSALVAPVEIGAGALIGSGSVITQNVPADALAIARGEQVNKPGLAARLFKRLRAIKEGKSG